MISKRQKEQYVEDKYAVFFDSEWNAYRRRWQENIPARQYELGIISEQLTGDNILTKGELYKADYRHVPFTELEIIRCICGCTKCKNLYKMTHTIKKDCFLVGSKCINKARGFCLRFFAFL